MCLEIEFKRPLENEVQRTKLKGGESLQIDSGDRARILNPEIVDKLLPTRSDLHIVAHDGSTFVLEGFLNSDLEESPILELEDSEPITWSSFVESEPGLARVKEPENQSQPNPIFATLQVIALSSHSPKWGLEKQDANERGEREGESAAADGSAKPLNENIEERLDPSEQPPLSGHENSKAAIRDLQSDPEDGIASSGSEGGTMPDITVEVGHLLEGSSSGDSSGARFYASFSEDPETHYEINSELGLLRLPSDAFDFNDQRELILTSDGEGEETVDPKTITITRDGDAIEAVGEKDTDSSAQASEFDESKENGVEPDETGPLTRSILEQPSNISVDVADFIPHSLQSSSSDIQVKASFAGQPETVFEINPEFGTLNLPEDTFASESQRKLTITITENGEETSRQITIAETKDGGGEAHHLILSHDRITENIEGGLIGKLDTSDSGLSKSHEYSIVEDESGLFEISGNVLKLKDGSSIDYEAQPDRYEVVIASTDKSGNRVEQELTIWPDDVNEAPSILSIGVESMEDMSVSFDPESFEKSFEDEDSDYLEMIRIDSLPDNGVLVIDGENVARGQLIDVEQIDELEFHPDPNWNGNTDFTWSGFDGQSWSSESSPVHIFIEAVNDAPVVTVSVGNASIESSSQFDLELPEGAFTDIDSGDSLTYSMEAPSWLSIDPETGAISGFAGGESAGEHQITITATDAAGESASQSFSIIVEQSNQAPTITPIDTQSAIEDSAFEYDASPHFQDADDGDTLTYSAKLENGDPLPNWLSFDSQTGTLSGLPRNEDVGSLEIAITASDGSDSIENVFTIEVENTNDAPTVDVSISNTTTLEDRFFTLDTSSSFSDADLDDTLEFSAKLENGEELPEWISIDSSTGVLSGIPANGDVGQIRISVAASDGQATATDTFSLTVENTNDGPIVTSVIEDQPALEDHEFSIETGSHFSDLDTGDTLTFSAKVSGGDPLPDWISIDAETGLVTGTPRNENVGELDLEITASDGEESVSQSFKLTVENTNDTPILTSEVGDQHTPEGVAFSMSLGSHFKDVDLGDTLVYSASLEDGSELPDWLQIDADTGELSGTPENGDVGEIRVSVTASDGEASESDTFAIAVENTNDGPVASAAIVDRSALEDSEFLLETASNFTDEDLGDELTFSAQQTNGDPLPEWLSFDETSGTLSGTPRNEDVGELSLVVSANDGVDSGTATYYLTVENTNDGPIVVSSIDDQSALEDSAFSLDTRDNFLDEDLGDTLTFSASLANGDPLPDWIAIDPDTGVLSGTPRNADVGEFGITITASDGEAQASEDFTLSIENTNDAPTLTAGIPDTSVSEDSAFILDVSDKFSDPDLDDTLTFSATLENGDPLPNWLSLDDTSGELSGTPSNEDVGDLSITITASDGESHVNDTFLLSVENTNDGPTATLSIQNQTTGEDNIFSLDVAGNFEDEDLGDTLTFEASLQNGDPLPDWLSFDSETGELSGTPRNDDVGNLDITIVASDGESEVSQNFTLAVENTNDAPILVSQLHDESAVEDAAFSLDVSGHFSDIDTGDELAFEAALENGDPLPAWLHFNEETGIFDGQPANDDVGEVTISVTATDGSEIVSDTFTLSVENTNDGPVVHAAVQDQSTEEDAAFSLDLSGNFGDEDLGDTLSYSATLENGDPLPDWLSIDPGSGLLSGTPGNDDVGEIAIAVTATDGELSAGDAFTLNVANTNDGPVVSSSIQDQSTDEDSAFSLEVSGSFSDEDLGDTLSYSATLENGDPLPSWLSIDSQTGTLSGVPHNDDVGELAIIVTASDGTATASDTFELSVANTNDGPVVHAAVQDQSTEEDAAFSLDLSGNFGDEDLGDTLSYSATLENGDPLPDWLSIDPGSGLLSGTPGNDDVGEIAIAVTATDGELSAGDAFTLNVANTNDGPVVSSSIQDQSTDEDSAFSLEVSGSFSDEDLGDTLSYSATLENGDPLPSWLSIDSQTGTLSGVPHNDDVGELAITVTASDGTATASDTFELSVANTNDGPVVHAAVQDQSTEEDAAFSLDLSGNFGDEDLGDTLSYSATLENGDPLPDWLSIDPGSGLLSGTPGNDDVGEIAIAVTATDGELSAGDAFTLNVANTNDGPVVSSSIQDQSTDEDSAFSLDVSGSFSDEDLGDTLSYSATLENGDPLPSWLSIDSQTGTLSGVPRNGDVGDYSIIVTASDSQADVSQSFTLSVDNVNDGPMLVANIASANTLEDELFVLDTSSHFLDLDSGDTLTYSATLANGDPLPTWLSFDNDTSVFSGTPLNEDVGQIAVTVSASDGEATISDTFDLTVFNTNDAPLVQWLNENQSIDEDALFILDASSIFIDIDEGDTLEFSALLENGDPLPDWINLDPITGELSGTPRNEDVGEISLTLTASDGEASTSKTFSLYIENTNDGPIVTTNIADQSVSEDTSFNLDASTSFSDDDLGEPLTFTATLENGDPLPGWMSIDSETGEISGTPRADDVGNLSVTVTASDGEASASDTFSLTVENTNDGPVVTSQVANQTISEDSAFSLDVSQNFADEDIGDTLSFSAKLENGDPLPAWINFDSNTGLLTGTPLNEDVGELAITVTASDGEADVSDTFVLTIENTNDGPVVSSSINDVATDEDDAFTLETSDHFEDEDLGDSLIFSATLENGDPLPTWMGFDSETGTLSGTPRNSDVGVWSVTITASDGQQSASDTFNLTVENTNDGLSVSSNIANQAIGEDSLFNLDTSNHFSEEDLNDTISYAATLENGDPLPDWLTIDAETGIITGTPENGDIGEYEITVTASDGEAFASDTFSLTVENTNDGPIVISNIEDGSAIEDTAFSLDLSSNFGDEDLGDALTFTATLENGDPLPSWTSFNSETGVISGTPRNADVGTLSITVTASDGEASVSDSFDLTVINTNDGPVVASMVPNQSTNEDASFSLDTSPSFSDPDAGDALIFSAALENGDPLPDWLSIDPNTGVLSGTPANDDVGVLSITVTASDGETDASDTFDLTVANTNDGPVVASNIADVSASEDDAFNLDIASNFADEDSGDTLSFSALLTNESGDVIGDGSIPDWLSFDGDSGRFSGTPTNSDVGSFCVQVTASDGESTVSDIFAFNVENTNDGPTVSTSIVDTTTNEDEAFYLDVSSSFSDLDAGDALTFSASLQNGDPMPDWLSINSDTGVLSGTPGNADVGTIDITVTASDGEASVSDTFSLNVANTNDGPTVSASVANADAAEDSPFHLDVSGNFSDVDIGDTLTYSATLENGDPLPNWLSIDPNSGILSGVPESGDFADISVTVTASDGEASASDTLLIAVNGNPDLVLSENETLWEEDFSGLSNGATSDNGDTAWSTDETNATISPTHGVANESYEFSKTTSGAYDDDSLLKLQTEEINISGKTDLNLTFDLKTVGGMEESGSVYDYFQVIAIVDDEPHEIYQLDGNHADGDGVFHTISLAGLPEGDSLVLSFEGKTTSTSEVFTLDNIRLNGDTVGLANQSATEDSTFSLDVSNSFADVDGDSLTYEATLENGDPLPDWLSINTATGELSGTPEDSDVGSISVVVTASDGEATTSGTFSITVEDSNLGPVANADTAAVIDSNTIEVDVISNDTDANNDALTITNASVPNGSGSVSIVDNKLVFDPGNDFATLSMGDSETIEISYTISDGDGGESTSTVNVTVTGDDSYIGDSDSSHTVTGTDNSNTILGNAGHDNIYGEGGDDTIVGGTGNDNLYGGAGDDTFLVSEGDGYDDFEGGEGHDTVRSTDGSDIRIDGHFTASDSVESIDAGGHSGVKITGDGSSQTLDFSETDLDGVESIEGGGGHDTIVGSEAGDTIVGGTGDDNLYGGAGDDTFLVSEGDGYDDFEGGEGHDTVRSTDGSDIRIDGHFTASDSVESIDAGGHSGVKITGDGSSQTLDFSETDLDGVESIEGGGGHDTIVGSEAGDTIVGGTGDDNLYGGAGDDTFLVSEGDGYDDFEGGEGHDTVRSTDGSDIRIDGHFTASDSVESIDAGGHSGVKITGDGSSQTLDFSGTDLDGIESIEGGGGHDTITGTEGDDTIVGGTGDDNLHGGGGDDTFLVSEGDEYDDFFGGEGHDTVRSTDGSDIRIDGHFTTSNSVESIDAGGHDGVKVTGDGSSQTLDFSETDLDGIESIEGGGGHDTITGTEGDDTIVGGTGYDNLHGGGGDDTFLVSEGDEYDDFFGGEGHDTVRSTDGSDIRIDGHFTTSNSVESIDAGGHDGVKVTGDGSSQTLDFSGTDLDGIESIEGGGGHDTITGTEGDDTIVGGTGDDNLHGGGGDDTFLVSEGDEYDDFFGGEGHDTVRSTDGSDIRIDGHFTASNSVESIDAGGHDGVKVTGDGSSQTLDFSETDLDGIESIEGGGGHDTITGTEGDDTIVGGTGHDDLHGGGGDDTFLVSEGDEYDDFFGGEGHDTVRSTDGSDIRIDGHFTASNSVESIDAGGHDGVKVTGDGSSQTLDFSETDLEGVEGIDAGGGHDTVSGSSNSETIDGGSGSDTLELEGIRSEYQVTDNGDGTYEVRDLVDGRGGIDTVTNFESFRFADGTYNAIDVLDNPPTLESEVADQSTAEDVAFNLDISSNFSDIDGDTLTFSATLQNGDPLPGWLSINPATGELSGTPANGDVGSVSVTVTASDGEATASDTFSLTVANTNDGPTVSSSIADQSTDEDAAFSLDVSGNFADEDIGDTLTFSALLTNESGDIIGDGSLPDWLSFDGNTGQFTGTPGNGDVDSFCVQVTATDGESAASDILAITVANTNDGPTVTSGIADTTTNEDAAFNLDVSGNFSDEDLGDTLTYSATLQNGDPLPEWLSINPASGELSGTPANDDVGSVSVTVTASDGEATASDTFSLTVANTNDGPIVSTSIVDLNTDENAAFSLDISSNFSDADLGDTLSFTATLDNGDPLPSWLTFNTSTGQFSGTPSGGDEGTIDIKVTASDGTASANDTFSLTVDNTNVGPNVAIQAGQNLWQEDFTGLSQGATSDNGDSAWTTDDTDTTTAPTHGVSNGAYEISQTTSTSNDDSALLKLQTEAINISGKSNLELTFDLMTTGDMEESGSVYDYFQVVAIVDGVEHEIHQQDGNHSGGDGIFHTISLSGLPTGDSLVLSFEGKTTSTSEAYTIDNISLDGDVIGLANQSIDEGETFSLDVSSNFSDADVGDTLTYSAILDNGDPLPSWLSFNSSTGVFSGTPADGDNGAISVTVTASDGYESVSDTFEINIADTINPPIPLIGQWKLDETTGTTASDTVSVNDGVYHHGVNLAQSGLLNSGTAAKFDGSNDYVEIGPSNEFQIAEGTFVVTFNTDHLSGQQTLFSRDSSGYDGGGHLDAYVESDGTLTVRFQSASQSYYVSSSPGAINAGTNHQIAFSFGSQGMKLSLDGAQVDTDAYAGGIGGNNEPITIGASQSSSGNDVADHMHDFFDGTIDNLEIYGGQLAQSSISALYAQVAPEPEPALIGQWKLDETGGTTAGDSVGTNDGTYQHGVILGTNGVLDTGTAATFDGANDYVEIAPSTDFQLDDGTFVVSFSASDLSSDRTLFSRDSSGYDGGGHLDAYVESDGTVAVRFQSPSHSYYLESAPGAVAVGENHQIAFSFGSSGAKLFLDGSQVDTETYTGGIGGNNEPITIGASQVVSGDGVANNLQEYFSGTIDNLEIYDGQLSQASIDSLYAQIDDNAAPIVGNQISDQSVDEDEAFNLDISGNFSDADVGDTLTYSATLQNGDPLPTWLSFNTTTGQFSGTPTDGDDGAITIKVTASDGEATAFDIFDIDVLPPPELVGQWKLDEINGTTASDSVGTNDGTLHQGVALGSNGVLDTGTAANFDGANDYIEIAPSTDFQLANGTFVVSFNADDLSTDRTLFSRDSSGYDGGGHLDAYVESDGTVAVRFQSPSHSYYLESAPGAVAVGENHQIAFSFGSKGVKLFLDGAEVDSDAYTGGIEGNNEPITIGASQVVSGDGVANNLQEFFSGRIDNLEIYDGQISQSEVSNLYAQLSDPDQSVTGTTGADTINTGSGDDTIDTEGGADSVNAGTGDDAIVIEDTSFSQLDFGTGEDTLVIDGSGIDLDFSVLDASKISNVETIDLNGSGANSIHLSASDVLDMTDGDKILFIEGGSDESVELSVDFANQGTETINGVDYNHYYDSNTDAHLYINSDISDLNTF